jgi:hypothetical protein
MMAAQSWSSITQSMPIFIFCLMVRSALRLHYGR